MFFFVKKFLREKNKIIIMKFNERKDFSIMKLVKNIFLSSFICLILVCAGAYGATPGGSSGNDNGSSYCPPGKYFDADADADDKCTNCPVGYACSDGSISPCSITENKITSEGGASMCGFVVESFFNVDTSTLSYSRACTETTTTSTTEQSEGENGTGENEGESDTITTEQYILVYPDGAAYGCGDTIGENTHCPDGFEQKTEKIKMDANTTFVVTYCQQCAQNKISVGGAACQACASGYTTIREEQQDQDCQDPLNGLGCKSCVKKAIKMCLEINKNSNCSYSLEWPDGLLIGKVNTSNIRKKSKWYNTIGVLPGCENAVYVGGMVQCKIK